MKSQTGLGKGLGALIQNKEAVQSSNQDEGKNPTIIEIEITKIKTNPFQPRVIFDPDALKDLVESIRIHGVIQPIAVRPSGNAYELIAGERRIRASIEAGLENIPAIILDIDSDQTMIELAIIENVQRENLNDIEIAMGYNLLMDKCKLTQEEVAQKVGKDRATIANFLRLLKLPIDIQQKLAMRELTNGHARALLALTSSDNQKALAERIITEDLSVRETENIIREMMGGVKRSTKKSSKKQSSSQKHIQAMNSDLIALEDSLREHFTTQVSIQLKEHENGKIEITFFSLDDLQRVIELILNK
jgi:ParB family chromosome partitioning protein